MKAFFRKLVRIFVGLLAAVGLLTLLLVGIGIVAVAQLDPAAQSVPDQVVLEIDFGKGLVEYVPEDPIAQALSITDKPTTVRDVVLGLKRAAADERGHHLDVALLDRKHERGLAALLFPQVGVRAAVQQLLHDVDVALPVVGSWSTERQSESRP